LCNLATGVDAFFFVLLWGRPLSSGPFRQPSTNREERMSGTEFPTTPSDRETPSVVTARIRDDREQAPPSAPSDALPLRRGVASLQHWIDLNA
jgi:hypothetical protein